MEINKSKLILAIICALLLGAVIFLALLLNLSSEQNTQTSWNQAFTIWLYNDNEQGMLDFIPSFKDQYPQYKNNAIIVESFSDYREYYYALANAFSTGVGPDLFVLNNSEKLSIFENQILALDPNIFNPNDFRKKYVGIFWDELIQQNETESWVQEFLRGVPIGYETMGLFYNRRYVKSADLVSFSSLNSVVANIAETRPNVTPFWVWNGSTVYDAAEVIAQFFLLEEWITGLSELVGPKLKESLSLYFIFWDESWDNRYNDQLDTLQATGKNNIDLFSQSNTAIIPAYPRALDRLKERWFSKAFLLASPFPHYFAGSGKTLINYNYFVLNKDTQNTGLAYDFLSYISSDTGAKQYLDQHPYYLPALLSLESVLLDKKIVQSRAESPPPEMTTFLFL